MRRKLIIRNRHKKVRNAGTKIEKNINILIREMEDLKKDPNSTSRDGLALESLANFFLKGADSKYFRITGHTISIATIQPTNHRHYIDEWA